MRDAPRRGVVLAALAAILLLAAAVCALHVVNALTLRGTARVSVSAKRSVSPSVSSSRGDSTRRCASARMKSVSSRATPCLRRAASTHSSSTW